jgi:hypothetical protein
MPVAVPAMSRSERTGQTPSAGRMSVSACAPRGVPSGPKRATAAALGASVRSTKDADTSPVPSTTTFSPTLVPKLPVANVSGRVQVTSCAAVSATSAKSAHARRALPPPHFRMPRRRSVSIAASHGTRLETARYLIEQRRATCDRAAMRTDADIRDNATRERRRHPKARSSQRSATQTGTGDT